jgi:hypothetical protein
MNASIHFLLNPFQWSIHEVIENASEAWRMVYVSTISLTPGELASLRPCPLPPLSSSS